MKDTGYPFKQLKWKFPIVSKILLNRYQASDRVNLVKQRSVKGGFLFALLWYTKMSHFDERGK